jgi:LPXTG-site transpeptidase (sortase) family protein
MSYTKSKIKDQRSKLPIKYKKFDKLITGLIVFGASIFIIGILIFFLTFFPIIKEEAKFALRKTNLNLRRASLAQVKPIDTNFGIVIPKILANAKVIDNVDPYNSKNYQYALTKGVAHARGTAYPGNIGNIFIFAHSSSNWFTANQYNSVFYLIDKLDTGDKIDLYYKEKKYTYEVFNKKIVESSDVSYLNNLSNLLILQNSSILTLMTCWPPGTTFKRLIIQAKIN